MHHAAYKQVHSLCKTLIQLHWNAYQTCKQDEIKRIGYTSSTWLKLTRFPSHTQHPSYGDNWKEITSLQTSLARLTRKWWANWTQQPIKDEKYSENAPSDIPRGLWDPWPFGARFRAITLTYRRPSIRLLSTIVSCRGRVRIINGN